MAVKKIADLSTNFVEFLYRKYDEPFVDKRLLKFIRKDKRLFLKKQGIREEKV
jgi:hypothetical protein